MQQTTCRRQRVHITPVVLVEVQPMRRHARGRLCTTGNAPDPPSWLLPAPAPYHTNPPALAGVCACLAHVRVRACTCVCARSRAYTCVRVRKCMRVFARPVRAAVTAPSSPSCMSVVRVTQTKGAVQVRGRAGAQQQRRVEARQRRREADATGHYVLVGYRNGACAQGAGRGPWLQGTI
jgi:hypothetical protein